MPYFTYKTQQR